MITMTSLEAQNKFGLLLDSSQREPVTITRHGRPIAVVNAYNDNQTIPYHIAQLISQNFALRGLNAGNAMRYQLANLPNHAANAGLGLEDLTRMLNED